MQHPIFYVRLFQEEYTQARKDKRGFLAHFKDNSEWLSQLDEDVLARNALDNHFRFTWRLREALRLIQTNDTEAWTLIEELREDLLNYNAKTWVCC